MTLSAQSMQGQLLWHGTTILTVRKAGRVVVAGDGQVSMGQTIIKANARKVRTLGKGNVISGFAGATADAFTLFERLEAKLDMYPEQLVRACVDLAKDWRTDRYLRRLEAMMIVADKNASLVLTGTGDVLEPEHHVMGIGSGGNYARPRPARLWTRIIPRRKSHARRWLSPRISAFIQMTTSYWKACHPWFDAAARTLLESPDCFALAFVSALTLVPSPARGKGNALPAGTACSLSHPNPPADLDALEKPARQGGLTRERLGVREASAPHSSKFRVTG